MFKKISFVIGIFWAIYSSVECRTVYPPCLPLGIHEKDAVNQVLTSNQIVTPVVIYKQVTNITNDCCNRVWIYVDQPGGNGIVENIPAVG
ncbi:unnamed protein product [Withania somnifera]